MAPVGSQLIEEVTAHAKVTASRMRERYAQTILTFRIAYVLREMCMQTCRMILCIFSGLLFLLNISIQFYFIVGFCYLTVLIQLWSKNSNAYLNYFFSNHGATAPCGPECPQCRGFTFTITHTPHTHTHTHTHTTLGSAPLDEWSTSRRPHYLHNKQTNTRDEHPFPQRDSNPRPQKLRGCKLKL